MGQDNPDVKQVVLAFGEGAVTSSLPAGANVGVWIFDHTSQLKFLPKRYDPNEPSKFKMKPVQNGYDYVMKCFLSKPQSALTSQHNTANVIYLCLDRGSPINKSIVHDKRYKSVQAMVTPEDASDPDTPSLLNDYQMPCSTDNEWKSFIGNSYLYRNAIHYITMRMIGTRGNIEPDLLTTVEECSSVDYDDTLPDFTLDQGKTLFLHGGRLKKPDPNRPRFFQHPEPALLEFKTETKRTDFGFETKRSVSINKDHPMEVINNLLEGEVAAMYYAQRHLERRENVNIVTPDFDVLMMGLLSCPDRINPATGKFDCNLFVCLEVSAEGKTKYVNVHTLWYNIHCARPHMDPILEDRLWCKNRDAYEYVSKFCAACLLCGSDYVRGYCKGIKSRTGALDEDVLKILFDSTGQQQQQSNASNKLLGAMKNALSNVKAVPWVIHTFLKHYKTFESMIVIKRLEGDYDPIKRMRFTVRLDIDESLFIQFTHAIYIEKYAIDKNKRNPGNLNAFEKIYGTRNATIETVRDFLDTKKWKELEKKIELEKKRNERASKLPTTHIVNGAVVKKKEIKPIDVVECRRKIKTNRVPPKRVIRVTCRHLLWQMNYILNGYKNNCSLTDPTTLYLDLPYYGWVLIGTGKCKVAKRVSIKRPNVDETKRLKLLERRKLTDRALENASEKKYALLNEEKEHYDLDVEMV